MDLKLDPSIARAINHFLACKIEEAKTDTLLQIKALQKMADDLNIENEELSAESYSKTNTLSVQIEQNAFLTGRIQQMVADAEHNSNELIRERQASEKARLALSTVDIKLESLSSVKSELKETSKELMQSRLEAAELRGQLTSIKGELNK